MSRYGRIAALGSALGLACTLVACGSSDPAPETVSSTPSSTGAPSPEASGASDICGLLDPVDLEPFTSSTEKPPEPGRPGASPSCYWPGAVGNAARISIQEGKQSDPASQDPKYTYDLGGIPAYGDGDTEDGCAVFVPAPDTPGKIAMMIFTPDTELVDDRPVSEGDDWCTRAVPAMTNAVQRLGWA